MSDYTKKIDKMDLLAPGDHAVFFYEKKEEIINTIPDFIVNSLKRNQKCYYIDEKENQKEVMIKLKKSNLNIKDYLERSQLKFFTKEEVYGDPADFNAQKIIDLLEEKVIEAQHAGYSGLTITGELKGIVNFKGGKEEVIKYEWKLHDQIFKKYPVIALCRYNINQFDNEIIKAAVELHDYIVWQGELHENPYYIDPEGYKQDKVEEYEIKSWFKNIKDYQKKESSYKKKIRHSQEKYINLYNSAPVGIITTSSSGKVIHVNQKMAEIAGYDSIAETINNYNNLGAEFYVRSERRDYFLNELKQKQEVENFEFEAIKNNGEHIWLNMNAQISEINNDGSFIIEGFVFDISEKKRYEFELEKKKEALFDYNQQLQAYSEETTAMNEELESSFNELEKLNNRFEKMIALVSDIDNLNTISENEFLSKILQQAVEIVPEADYGSVYIFGDQYIEYIDCVGFDLEVLRDQKIKNEAFYNNNSAIGTITAAELKARNEKHMSEQDFKNLKRESLNKIKETMFMDLELNSSKKAGISLDIKGDSSNIFTDSSKKIFNAFYNIASSFYKLKEYNTLQNDFTREIISSTIKMLEMYDLYTKGHSENVAELAVKIAEEMDLKQQRINDIYWAGMVHDLGKMLIPLEILNKKGKLTKSEYEVIKEHPVLGGNVLSSSDSLKHIANFVRHHHERWDGTGYPDGLKGEEIPLEAQIMCAADAWDAMRSKRTYRKPLSFNHALAEIKGNKGTQFAPKAAEALIGILMDNKNL